MRRGLLCVALLCGACSVANASMLRRDEPEPASVAPEAAPMEESGEEEPAATGSEYLRDFPHDRTFHDHADKTIPSHKHMMEVAKDVKGTQNVKLMLSQLDVLRSYLTKLSVRHEFLMEKYHAVLEGGEDKKLRRMVAEIVGDELKKREAERESIVQEIVEKVVGILKDDLGLDAGAVDDADKPDDKLQQEAIQEAVADALKEKQDVEDNEQTEEAPVGASDRVLDDFDEEGEDAGAGSDAGEGTDAGEGSDAGAGSDASAEETAEETPEEAEAAAAGVPDEEQA